MTDHDEDTTSTIDEQDSSTERRFNRYKAQRRALGLSVPTWSEWMDQRQPLYDD